MNILLLLPLLLALLGAMRDSPRDLPEAFARPQTTIANYWHSMIEHRHSSALECFAESSNEDADQMLTLPDLVELRCRDFTVAQRGRGLVDVTWPATPTGFHLERTDRLSPAASWTPETNIVLAAGTNRFRSTTAGDAFFRLARP